MADDALQSLSAFEGKSQTLSTTQFVTGYIDMLKRLWESFCVELKEK